jgi:signal transduction histidine kinase
MVNEVGKYKDVKEHLPKVKLQLQSMRRVIDEILNLNNSIEEIKNENIIVSEIVEQSLLNQELQIKTKELKVDKELNLTEIVADRKILYKIIDNLVSNATNYTPNQELIKITLTDNALTIINYGVQIEEEILPHIFEPFVSSSGNKGHGMGLYIVAYYAELSNMRVDIRNEDNRVSCTLHFKKA